MDLALLFFLSFFLPHRRVEHSLECANWNAQKPSNPHCWNFAAGNVGGVAAKAGLRD